MKLLEIMTSESKFSAVLQDQLANVSNSSSIEPSLPEVLITWRLSLLCKSLSGCTLSVNNCSLIIQYGRKLNDDTFLHDALKSSASTHVGPEIVAKCVASLAQRKGEIPDNDLQRYCETILSANGEAIKTSNLTSLKSVQKLVQNR